jgi:hypothetical protein
VQVLIDENGKVESAEPLQGTRYSKRPRWMQHIKLALALLGLKVNSLK